MQKLSLYFHQIPIMMHTDILLILQRNNDQNTAEILEIYVLIRKEQERTQAPAIQTPAILMSVLGTLQYISMQ